MFSEGLPSTFLGKHGWVQYYCKSALKEASGLAHKNQQVFIVMNPIDLNQEPAILAVSIAIDIGHSKYFPVFLQQPFHCEIEHKLGMTCLTTGPVTCRYNISLTIILLHLAVVQGPTGQGRLRARRGNQHLGNHRQPEQSHHKGHPWLTYRGWYNIENRNTVNLFFS